MSSSSRSADVILKLIQSIADQAERRGRRRANTTASGDAAPTTYTALMYSNLDLELEIPTSVPAGVSTTLCDLPLAGAERLEIGWSDYREYLAAFVLGEGTTGAMRSRLLRAIPTPLAAVLRRLSEQSVRLWLSSECPELDEMPWELLLADPAKGVETDLSAVRGLPPRRPRPLVPLQGKPRLALIGSPPFAPHALWDRLRALQNVEVIALSGDPRDALRHAATESFALLHVVADGFVTQAYEGALYFHSVSDDPSQRTLTVSELASQLLASQVAVLGLTPPDYYNPDLMMLAGQPVPSAYRAYARLAVSEPTLPTILAPLGPLDPPQEGGAPRLAQFWGEFYEGVGEFYDVEKALRRARQSVKAAPMALFLRHPSGKLFRRVATESTRAASELAYKTAEYALSLKLTERLRALDRGLGGFSKNVTELLNQESGNLEKMASELESSRRSEE